jgi:hypothetical protein
MGADDYITKPFSQRLLVARIRAILRRVEVARADAGDSSPDAPPAPDMVQRGRLSMDPARHEVRWDDKPVSLTVTEFLILETLAQRPGVIKSRNQLMDCAYNDDTYVDDRTIDRTSSACAANSVRLTRHFRPSKRFMARAIPFPRADERPEDIYRAARPICAAARGAAFR